ncbi:hypothetical protein F5144DRAFT_544501 [Chaetomium tenue]|uniref:Uncharacterized protein n=1 Tax=Chaetomium tenue TaxID=1854479 RepID=A0ACB7PEQ0_9PEZI|nr:hypothetical protein F5144DRAFT_544501 [Chaetomium globosum]
MPVLPSSLLTYIKDGALLEEVELYMKKSGVDPKSKPLAPIDWTHPHVTDTLGPRRSNAGRSVLPLQSPVSEICVDGIEEFGGPTSKAEVGGFGAVWVLLVTGVVSIAERILDGLGSAEANKLMVEQACLDAFNFGVGLKCALLADCEDGYHFLAIAIGVATIKDVELFIDSLSDHCDTPIKAEVIRGDLETPHVLLRGEEEKELEMKISV